jgi:hypothetical protein
MRLLLVTLTTALALLAVTGGAAACGCGCTGESPCGDRCGKHTPQAATTEAADTETTGTEAETPADVKAAGETATADQPTEPAAAQEPGCMLDVFKRLEVGNWVRTRWTNKEEHTLLVAAKTDRTITIEEIVEDRGLTKAWTQLDVSLEDGSLLALRERLADGTIEEREPDSDAQQGTSDLLVRPFRPDGHDEQQGRIEVFAGDQQEPQQVLRGTFLCRRYKITVEEGRYAHIWFSQKKLPDYPIKIHYYERNLTIELKAFGTGRASTFTQEPEPHGRTGTS